MIKSMKMEDMKKCAVWVAWQYEKNKDGKETKIPKNPFTGNNAKSNDPKTWGTYGDALQAKASYGFSGVGFMFAGSICGVDLDHQNLDDPFVKDLIAHFATYTEKSPSGTGLHIIFTVDKSKLPEAAEYKRLYYQKNESIGTECYIAGITNRFFTYTGKNINSLPICDKTDQLLAFLNKHMLKPTGAVVSANETSVSMNDTNDSANAATMDEDILNIARKAQNGDKFKALFDDGDISEYNNDQSCADMALCSLLAFYFQGNAEAIDRVFRQSKLMRDKWEREDYRADTISKAIAGCKGKFYKPPGSGQVITINSVAEYLKAVKIGIRYNVINRIVDIEGLDKRHSPEHAADILPVLLFDTLKTRYKSCTQTYITNALSVISTDNRYNPVLDMLNKVKWDKKDRLPEVFAILGIKDNDRLSKLFIFKWLWQCLSMCRNELNGSAYGADGMLCLIGGQGIGKTSFFRKLAVKEEFFYEGKSLDFRDKDTIRRASSTWICELGEVESTLRSDIEKLKAFVTDPIDMYRLPYGRADVRLARRTSLCATGNSDEFLIDPTGNRRFWSVPVERVDLDLLSKLDSLQLWAQVDEKTRHNRQGFRLTREEQADLAARNNRFEKPLKAESEIRDILAMAENDTDRFETKRITVLEFKSCYENLRNYSTEQIGRALTKLGILAGKLEKKDGEVGRFRDLPVPCFLKAGDIPEW